MNTELNEAASEYSTHGEYEFHTIKEIAFKAGAQWQAEQKQSAGDGLDLNKHLEQLFLECEHGDEQHRKWLKDKFDNYVKQFEQKPAWVELKKELPPPLTVVLGYSKKWIDEDYEPEGIREAFMQDDGDWLSAKWNNSMDAWMTDDVTTPTHWMKRPSPPINK